MTTTIIKNGLVVTMDLQRRLIEDGAVVFEDNRIIDVGKTTELSPKYDSARRIDAKNKLILPGFIDGHNHPAQYLAKGIGDDVIIMKWLTRIWPYEAYLTPEDVYISALGDFVEMIRSGTTCFAAPDGYHMDEAGRAMREIGIRGILARSTRDLEDPALPIPPALSESTEENLEKSEDLVKRWHGSENDRIRAWFSLRTPLNSSDRLCREIKALADRYKVGMHVHCSGNPREVEGSLKKWGARTAERYYRLGLFGPNLYLIHMGWVNEKEIDLLKEHDVKVCHCPTECMLLASGGISHGMIPKMVKAGVNVSLGSDSAPASRFLDMVRIMYLAAAAHKDVAQDGEIMGAYQALEMATVNGARSLLWEDQIGSIEKGKKADIILIDTQRPEWHPLRDPICSLVYSADGNSVDTVIIDGQVVMANRKILTVNEKDVLDEVAQHSSAVLKRAGIEISPRWPVV